MTYVLSDIHGNERRFASVMKQIDLRPEDTLWVLGDVVDRHPGGIRILRKLMAMPNARLLLGNHEYMMLRAIGHPVDENIDDGRATEHWYRNGGEVTHRSFKWQRKAVRREIIEYLHSLPLEYDLEIGGKRYKLVHAAPAACYDPADPKYRGRTHFAVWKRLDEGEVLPGGYTLIFGHTPTQYFRSGKPMTVWYGPDRIGIDCGSGYPEGDGMGRLACLRLEDGRVFYSEEG